MKNTVFPHKFWRPFLDCMPQLFFRPEYVWFPVHLKGLLIPLWYETLVVNWQNWLFTLFHQGRSVLLPNPIDTTRIYKNPARALFVAVWGQYWPQHGLFTGCLWYLNPYGVRKLIMHALKLYGPRAGRQNLYGGVWGLYGPMNGHTIFVQKSPGRAHEVYNTRMAET